MHAMARFSLPGEDLVSFADALPEAMLVHRHDKVHFVNQACLDLFGFSSRNEALHENDLLVKLIAAARSAAKGPMISGAINPSFCLEARRTDGATITLQGMLLSIRWEGESALLLRMTRMSSFTRLRPPRRAAGWSRPTADSKENKPHSEQQLRLLIDTLPLMLVYKDRDGFYRYVNKPYADWLGCLPGEIIGRHISEVRGEEVFRAQTPLRKRVLAGETVSYETERHLPGRGLREIVVSLSPHFDTSGEVVGYFSFMQDVTELKRARHDLALREQQLHLICDSLPVLISYKDRNLRYQYVNRTYEEWYGFPPEHLVGRHVSEVHNLSILRTVKSYMDRALAGETVRHEQWVTYPRLGPRNVLVSYVPHKDESGHVAGFFTIVQDITRTTEARQTLNESADHGTSDPERQQINGDWIDVERLISECLEAVRAQRLRVPIRLVRRIARNLPLVRGDRGRLRQIVLNLLANAIRLTPSEGRISVSCRLNRRGELIIRIRDNGTGVAKEDIPHLLRPIGEGEMDIGHWIDGMGLGLPMVVQTVEMHGGSFELDSAPDRGTTATVRLPPDRLTAR